MVSLKKLFVIFLLTTILVSVVLIMSSCEKLVTVSNSCKVVEVIDGDTIKVIYNGAETSVRYIGIDAPETHSGEKPIGEYGQEAYQFNKKLISEAGNKVTLEFDKQLYGTYHRLLAYVYVHLPATTVMLNADIIKNGLAWPLTYFDTSKHTKEFWSDYGYAYQHRLGLFSKYATAPIVDASTVDDNLSAYVGKLTWVKFHPTEYSTNSYFVSLSSTYFNVTVRTPELGEFSTPLNTLYLNKNIRVYGEVWERYGKGEMLLHAPFEFKIIDR